MKENSMEMVLVTNLPDLKGNKIRTNGNTTVSIAKLPKDIQELLKSFLTNFNNIGQLKLLLGNNITAGKEQEIDDAIRSTTLITKQLQKLTRNSYHISEQLLCDSHIALATCTDVGRMVFQTLLYRQPEELERYRALCLVTPPPVTLSRKIKHIIDKIKRIQECLTETTKKYDLTHVGNATITTTSTGTTSATATVTATNKINTHNLHTEDINGLLTDIENQYILVQRMISFLHTEINNLLAIQSKQCKPSTPPLPLVVVRDDLADSLQNLNLGTPRTNILQKEHDLIVNTRLGGSLASPVQFSPYRTDKKPMVSSRKECISPRKVSCTAWDKLRNTVKDYKRPTYSLELYEQFIEGQDEEEGQQTEHVLYKQNSIAYRQCSATYRHLRGCHRKSPSYEQQVQMASSTAVERYRSSLRVSTRLASVALDTPQKTPIPRDTSPYTNTDTASASWRLCLNSPGDWRHVQPYLPITTTSSGTTSDTTTASNTTTATRIEKAEVSPLIGVLQHINQYVQRQPKTPAPPSLPVPPPIKISPTTSAPVVGEVKSLSAVDSHTAGGSASLHGTSSSSNGGNRRQREGENEALPPRSRSGSSSSSADPGGAQEVLSPGRPRGDSMALKRSPKSSHLSGAISSPPGPLKLPGKKATIPAWMTESLSDTSATSTTTSTTTTAATVVENFIEEITQKLRAIYTANVPDKVGDVPKLLAKYAGKETELLEKVIKKYGPVPTASLPSATTAKKSITPTPLGAGEKPDGLSGMSLFGKSAQPSTGFGTASSSLLGKPSEAPATTTPGATSSLFGKPSEAPAATTPGATSSLFGKPSEAPAATTPGATSSLFGKPSEATAATTPGSTSSLFGKPSEAPATTTPGSTSSLFGKPATSAVAGGSASVGGGLFGSTSTAPAAGTALGGLEGVQQRVQAIYAQHNPSKLAEIPALMEKYRGRELQLVANLEKKYGVAPVTSVSSTTTGGAGLFGVAAGTGVGAATPTPTPFGGSSAIPSPFGGAASTTAGIPSPFGATGTGTVAGGNSLFGAGAAKPSGGLFGGQPSTGFGTGAAATTTGTTGTGGLFGSGTGTQGSTGVGGAVSPFANPTPTGGTGGLFGQASAAASGVVPANSSFGNSGFSTPLGKTAAPATTSSLFQAQGGGMSGQQQPSTGFGGLNMGGGGSMGGAIGGTTSPGLFGTAKPPAAGMTGGFGGATSTGFGMPTNANSGAGSLFSPSASAPVASGSAGLNSIQAVQQRVQAIYAQYNPSKLAEIPSLMEKYRGRELQLVANLEKKYNIDHHTSTANSGAGGMFGSSPGAGAGTGGLFRSPNRGCFGASPEIGVSTGFGAGMGGGSGPGAAASSLFGRPPTAGAGAAAGTGGLFGGLAAPSTQFGGTQQPQGSGGMGMSTGSGFGSTTVLGGGGSSSGFGSSVGSSFGGGGGLFGGGAANTNSMWGNR